MLNEVVPGCFATFYEGEVLDEKRLENWMKEERGSLTGEEVEIKNNVQKMLSKHTQWIRIKSSLNSTIQKFTSTSGDEVWGKATAKIDCSAFKALAWMWHLTAYERLKLHVAENGSIPRFGFTSPTQPHTIYQVVCKRFPIPFKHRIFYARQIWWHDEEEKTYYLAHVPSDFEIKFGAGHKSHSVPSDYVKALTTGLIKFKVLNNNVCEYTHHIHVDVGGSLPQRLIDYKISANLDVALELQLKYHRMPEVVDTEIREKFVEKIINQTSSETEKARSVASENATELLTERQWFPMRSGDPLTSFLCSRTISGEMTGKAKSVLDTSPELALAWWFDYCSNERMSIHRLSKNSAKLIVSTEDYDDQTIATIKHVPWPFWKREFVCRQVCWKDDEEEGAYFMSNESVSCENMDVDYGSSMNAVRGVVRQLVKFSRLGNNPNQTQIELIQFISSRGSLPRILENMKFKESLKPILDAKARFSRDDNIDLRNRTAMAHLLFENNVRLNDREKKIVEDVKTRFDDIHPESFRDIEGSDAYIKMSVSKQEKISIVRATTSYDGTLEEVAADVFNHVSMASRDSAKSFYLFGGLYLDHHPVSPGYSKFWQIAKPRSGKPRELVAKCLCYRDSVHELTIVVESYECNEHPKVKKYDRISARMLFKLKEGVSEVMESDGGGEIAHTIITGELEKLDKTGNASGKWQVATFAEFDLNNSVGLGKGKFRAELEASRHALEFLETSRNKDFDRGVDVDRAQRSRDMRLFEKADEEKYSASEDVTLASANSLFNLFKDAKFKKEKGVKEALKKDKKGHFWGCYETMVSADAEECLAFQWNVMSRASEKADTLVKNIIETKNAHNFTLCSLKVVHFAGVSNREFMNNFIYKKVGKNEWVLSISPVDKESPAIKHTQSAKLRPQKRGAISLTRSISEVANEHRVRAKTTGCWIFKQKGEKKTQVKFVSHINPGGKSGSIGGVAQKFYMKYQMKRVLFLKDYFLRLKLYNELAEDEGEQLADLFTTKTRLRVGKSSSLDEARVIDVVEHYKSMKELVALHPWFEPMMIEVMKNELCPNEVCETALPYLSKLEGKLIGKSLSLQLACNLSPDHATDSWLLQYPAMIQFERENIWFRPMIVRIGQHILRNVAWGMRLRVMTGGVSSQYFDNIFNDVN
ncbi:hypothetical protein TL16_g09136 [Triparma laevis f. inornata]|uniref:Uncharacterized protein n=1 Tax=Triparma laevis f. inornata TaxID=1714386 RepID=A0A9W7B1E4_9STRA|nr:hypothetical protein TL16_g09136 [Triparma laevis f. inornata]